MRFAVIGHTHHARIAVHDGGEDFFAKALETMP